MHRISLDITKYKQTQIVIDTPIPHVSKPACLKKPASEEAVGFIYCNSINAEIASENKIKININGK